MPIAFQSLLYPAQSHRNTYSESGVQGSYQDCCLTQKNPKVWKARQMMIWDNTEHRSGPEIRPDGGLRATSSVQAGFRLTAKRTKNKQHIESLWFSRAILFTFCGIRMACSWHHFKIYSRTANVKPPWKDDRALEQYHSAFYRLVPQQHSIAGNNSSHET